MSTEISLLDVPDLALTKILEECDFVSILILRKTCKTLRNFIDTTKPEQPISSICIYGSPKSLELQLYFIDNDKYNRNGPAVHIVYEKLRRIWCKITFVGKNRQKQLKHMKFENAFLTDFQTILNMKMPILQELKLKWNLESNILNKFGRSLASRFRPIQVQQIQLWGDRQADFLPILSNTCPETLESIELYANNQGSRLKIDKIAELEQWKQAQEIRCIWFQVLAPIQKFGHFNAVDVRIEQISMDDVLDLKETFLNSSSNSKKFKFQLKISIDVEELTKVFGHRPKFIQQGMKEIRQWSFKNHKNLEELSLEVRVMKESIEFRNINRIDAPKG